MKQPHTESLVSEIALVYRTNVASSKRIKITTTQDAYELFRATWDINTIELHEECKVMLLNQASKVLGICVLSTGGITGTVVDPRLLFACALKANAVSVVVAHNHPSGNLQPSTHDITLTRKLVEAGKLLDIHVLDHLIITAESFYSFLQEGMI